MPSPLWTRLIIAVAAALWFAMALALKAPVDAVWLKPAGAVMSVVVLLLLAYDRWAWRWLPTAVTKRPRVYGTWKAELQYQWPAGTATQTKRCYLTIRQTYSTISVNMHFDISDSESRSADIVTSNGKRSLWWSYWSAAKTLEREDNPPHRGGAELVISLKPSTRMDGDYWTERQTRGRIVTVGRCKQLYDGFADAERGDYAG
jgi:hypothetical protein